MVTNEPIGPIGRILYAKRLRLARPGNCLHFPRLDEVWTVPVCLKHSPAKITCIACAMAAYVNLNMQKTDKQMKCY
ncbi:hypothetical protein SAMN05216387_10668 [Nitrosovibrio tenuis]|uniref:Uncharacterized protein n=1 Tax=Nitrosovibrio tenuis TaxID=1233 RepID=A0A1H7N6X8_9PROT|nr:hypothetical protein SAMN05216387_10668 [Nitrosovibrio tenuis]